MENLGVLLDPDPPCAKKKVLCYARRSERGALIRFSQDLLDDINGFQNILLSFIGKL
jgi:hypothetical protein